MFSTCMCKYTNKFYSIKHVEVKKQYFELKKTIKLFNVLSNKYYINFVRHYISTSLTYHHYYIFNILSKIYKK